MKIVSVLFTFRSGQIMTPAYDFSSLKLAVIYFLHRSLWSLCKLSALQCYICDYVCLRRILVSFSCVQD